MNEIKPTVIKASGIVLNQEGKLLVVRKRDSDIWISLGGKAEQGETLEEALAREVFEEAGLIISGTPILFHTSPIEPAAGKPEITVQIFSYLIAVANEPKINPEDKIEEFYWLSKDDFIEKKFKLGSVLEHYVVPELIQKNLLK